MMLNGKGKIKNASVHQETVSRRLAVEIIEAGLRAIDTAEAVGRQIKFDRAKQDLVIQNHSFSLTTGARLVIIAIGKCANDASFALEKVLGDRITDGLAVDIRCDSRLRRIESCQSDHPYPSERNIDNTKKIIEKLRALKEDDLVVVVVSGGGSTFLCQPNNFTCHEEADLLKCLFRGGATIEEINTVRKHLSLARGGYLAEYAYPARVVGLIFSDVPGNDFSTIASGPTVFDLTTKLEAETVMKKYETQKSCQFDPSQLIETPKEAKYFERVENFLLVSNQTALEAMAARGQAAGLKATIVTNCLNSEASQFGIELAKEINRVEANTLLLYGGETTVKIKGAGRGGRNQELVLAALPFIDEFSLIVSIASDGVDNSDHAGAFCDMVTKRKAESLKLDINKYLANNDSYTFFDQTKDFLFTGPTGSNVSDLVLAIKK